ncbi:PHP domain-containing protein [Paenibacillus chibensis]|uniref:PHP domain-containing protein n=1 Tax=Paenibacillus chibensis TaxID=59846 RepID=A0ABU6PZB5_9BACL|nr:PHP domain-containing protein [Paenibacillus chibensis]
MNHAEGKCDLHTHTQASDGMQRPADNVRLACEKGLAAVAITDHDTVAGVAEALEEGGRCGIVVVPGVEISTRAGGERYSCTRILYRLPGRGFSEAAERFAEYQGKAERWHHIPAAGAWRADYVGGSRSRAGQGAASG